MERLPVALRKESVDRNALLDRLRAVLGVALRKESVDRNAKGLDKVTDKLESLSARRAWIEISASGPHERYAEVALRKESMECFSF